MAAEKRRRPGGSPIKRDRRERFRAWAAQPDAAIAELCEFIAENGIYGHIKGFCLAKDFRYSSVAAWIQESPERVKAVDLAREVRGEAMVETLYEEADKADELIPGSVQKARLKVDVLKWHASKLNRRYGDRVEAEVTHRVGDLPDDQIDARIVALQALIKT